MSSEVWGVKLSRLVGRVGVDDEERRLAGWVSGMLYLLGGITLAIISLLPGITHAEIVALLLAAGGACAWGALSLVAIDWESSPRWLVHLSSLSGFGLIAIAIASSGGATSPAWIYLFFMVVFVSYFYPRRVAYAYLAGCVAIHALPLLYDGRGWHDAFLAKLVIAAPAYLVLGEVIIAGKELTSRLRTRAEALATQQVSLRRVATAVVEGEAPERIYDLVASESAALLGGSAAGVLRFEEHSLARVMGSWTECDGARDYSGKAIRILPGSDISRARETGGPVKVTDHPPESTVRRLGCSASIVAPVRVSSVTWGVLAVTAVDPEQLSAEHEQALVQFGDLLATAIASIEDRAKLAAQASTDPLTGLANHRALQERLAAELARVIRHGGCLSVALIDIDHFKQTNDLGGHEIGDEMLTRVARCLSELSRAEDTLGRVGGDEFAWVLPETTREQALVAVERARRKIAAEGSGPYRITVSAGVCDTTVTSDPSEIVHLADGALYWSKAHGRNQCWVYDPAVIDELSAQERAERLQRSQALLGLRALARAIDAKDSATREHSERVSVLVGRLAEMSGWPEDQVRLLTEAALVHDVGKIGVPDAVLGKAAPLTMEECSQITAHAELSARIVEGVLTPEQVEWIRSHHERPDGEGYPDGLSGDQIPEGGALLALADAWDVMTVCRPYSAPKTPQESLEECTQLAGRQFAQTAVHALLKLHAQEQPATDSSAELIAPRR